MSHKGLNGSTIKLIAITAMVWDHIGVILLENGFIMQAPYSYFTDQQFDLLSKLSRICNLIGCLAFPLFCFLLVEGFYYTKNVKKYALNLGLFALISEPIYDWALFGQPIYWNQQNVFFTLLLGLITLSLIRHFNQRFVPTTLITLLAATLAYFLHLDGWYYGILMMVAFYLLRNKGWVKYLTLALIIYFCGLDFSLAGLFSPYLLVTLFSLVIIACYNQERGLNLKYVFYLFYPLHLFLLKVIAAFLTRHF